MNKHTQSFGLAGIIMVLGISAGWAVSMPGSVFSTSIVGGFCSAAACDDQFNAKCLGDNCPAGTTHDECITNGENPTKSCTTSGNCDDTGGCDKHDNCTCG